MSRKNKKSTNENFLLGIRVFKGHRIILIAPFDSIKQRNNKTPKAKLF